MFFNKKNEDYQTILRIVLSSNSLSLEQLLRFDGCCNDFLERPDLDFNKKSSICFTKAEICARLSLNFIAKQDDKNATHYYGAAFEACDLAKEYIDDLQEQQQKKDDRLLRESNSYGLITPEACRDKIYEVISNPLDQLIEKNHRYNLIVR